jgi:branched-chain amino acid transport system permease protein
MHLLDALLTGMVLGGIYALIALGLTLQYGVARIMNLSYGEVLVAAAFGAYSLFIGIAISPLVSVFIAVPIAFAVNWVLFKLMFVPLMRRADSHDALEVDSILVTFGLLFVIQGILLVIFGGQYYSYSYLSTPVSLFGSTAALNRLVACGFAAAIACSLYLVLMHTRFGTAIRAVAISPVSAQLVGINVAFAAAFAFALGGALVASAGVLVSMFVTFNAVMGVTFTMKAMIIVIMGGAGNLLGALLAGVLLGVVEAFVASLIDPGLTLAANFAIFLIVLLIRPTGIFGRPK